MNRIHIPQKFAMLAMMFLFALTSIAAAQVPIEQDLQAPSGISGKVVDLKGNAVAGFTFAIQPMQLRQGQLQPEGAFQPPDQKPPEDVNIQDMPRMPSKAHTASDGTFTVNDIQPGFLQLAAIPDTPPDAEMFDPEKILQGEPIPPELMRRAILEPDKKIFSIQIGKVIVFNNAEEPGFFQGITFALKPGTTLENVKITVKSRLRIHARIIYADGTPLINANGRLNMRQRDEFNQGSSGSYGMDYFTDDDGYFTQYMDVTGFYTVSVKYSGPLAGKELSAGVGPFLLKDGVGPEELVLTLDGNPSVVEPPPVDAKAPREIETPADIKARPAALPQAPKPTKSVWVVNPENGHAYKRIQCADWHDAQQKAVEEEAHLVSINDEDEQHWLQVIFRSHSTWIGLTDVEKEGKWQWDSGEPVTYTNWTKQPVFPDRLPDTEKDYVVFTFKDGEWQSVGPESPFWRMTREAIIEKDGLISKAPAAAPSDEE